MKWHIGTSGYGYREWLGKFYPPGFSSREMLPYYAERFSTVEINSTYYRMPSSAVLEGWLSQVPPDFVFAFKAPGLITHRQRLREAGEATATFAGKLSVVGNRLGPVLFQIPPYLPCDLPRLEAFLASLPRLRTAFEFRHPSWFAEEVYTVLRRRGCALCLSERDDAPPPPVAATADFGYVRLRRSAYSEAQLEQWRDTLAAQRWEEVFVYFRHETTATGPVFARRLLELVAKEKRK